MPTAPKVPQRPHLISRHEDERTDPYYWLMDRENPEVLAHLRSENAYLGESLARLKPLENELFEEIKGRIEETDISVPVLRGRGGTSSARVKVSTTRSAVAYQARRVISRLQLLIP